MHSIEFYRLNLVVEIHGTCFTILFFFVFLDFFFFYFIHKVVIGELWGKYFDVEDRRPNDM